MYRVFLHSSRTSLIPWGTYCIRPLICVRFKSQEHTRVLYDFPFSNVKPKEDPTPTLLLTVTVCP